MFRKFNPAIELHGTCAGKTASCGLQDDSRKSCLPPATSGKGAEQAVAFFDMDDPA